MKKNKDINLRQQQSKLKKRPANVTGHSLKSYFVLLSVIVTVTVLAYLPALQGGFLHWDDDKYLQNNPLILSFNLKEIFSTYVWGNYHPLTILVYAVEYHLFGLSAGAFHSVNVVLHVLNTILVFFLVLEWSSHSVAIRAGESASFVAAKERTNRAITVASITAILFGVHPMHVESVAWVAELKDLLYTFFFLLSLICYLKFVKEGNKKIYIYSYLLFIFSLLSKAMAVSLPVVMLLTDYFVGRKFNRKVLLEKIPFFILSIIFGVMAIYAQQSVEAILDISVLTLPQRIAFASYSFLAYLLKLIAPFHLSAYYPYPMRAGDPFPSVYYFYIIGLILLAVILWRMIIARNEQSGLFQSFQRRAIVFGIGFFAITVFLVLQFIPVGGAIMADRYSYIPSIGFFFLIAECLIPSAVDNLKEGREVNQKFPSRFIIIIVGVVAIVFSFATYSRCMVWKEDMILWNDVISKCPAVPAAYINMGNLLTEKGNYNEALKNYNKAIEVKPDLADAYLNRGTLLMKQKRNEEALKDFDKAIELRPRYHEAYNNRGSLYVDLKRNDDALSDYNKAIELKPDYMEGYNNRGIFFENAKKYDLALADYNRCVALRPDRPEGYYNRGMILMNLKDYDRSVADYSKAIQLNPGLAEAYYYRALIEYNVEGMGGKEAACADLKEAANRGFQQAIKVLPEICK